MQNQAAGNKVHVYCIDGRVDSLKSPNSARVQCNYMQLYSALQLGNIVHILLQPLNSTTSMLFEFTSVELECTYTVCHNNFSG